MLTIGQLARYARVSVRTVRHYHQVGLLPEPPRDESGYRRYGPQDVIDLVRITALAGAGVPLRRIGELLTADDPTFAAGLAEIDADLEERIAELQQRRRDLAQLPSAERLSVPPAVWALLDGLRSWGISDTIVAKERDTWILLGATHPQLVEEAATRRLRGMAERPEWRELVLTYQEAHEWPVGDTRLEPLARRTADFLSDLAMADIASEATAWMNDPAAAQLIENHDHRYPPSWLWLNQRVSELVSQHLDGAGDTAL